MGDSSLGVSGDMRPRTMSAPEDAGQPERNAPVDNRPRSKSVRIQHHQPRGVICHRSDSVVSKNGKRIVKNPGRIDSFKKPPDGTEPVPLFRLNSFVKDTGKKEEEGDEPERQQWDNPVEFLLSCISMSVGLGNVWRVPFTAKQFFFEKFSIF